MPEKYQDVSPGLFLLTHSTRSYPPGHHFRALVAQATLAGRGEVLPPCGTLLELQVRKWCFWLFSHKACRVVRDTNPQAMSYGRSSK